MLNTYIVDAFSSKPFKGNPAAVVILQSELEDNILQSIAAEMNLSETAFVYFKNNIYSLRWFTPMVEVSLCGHATIAASKVLFDIIGIEKDEIQYATKSGILTAKKHDSGICLDFPADKASNIEAPHEFLQALGISHIENCILGENTKKLVLHLKDKEQVLALKPDFEKMKNLKLDIDVKGVGVTAQDGDLYDFISRYFNPWAGVNEDPVTGSVHTVLAPYWSGLLKKSKLNAYQASKRGGELKLALNNNNRMDIVGDAVIVLKGILEI